MKTDRQKFQQIARLRAAYDVAKKNNKFARVARLRAVLAKLPSLIAKNNSVANVNEFYARTEYCRPYFQRNGQFRKGWGFVAQ